MTPEQRVAFWLDKYPSLVGIAEAGTPDEARRISSELIERILMRDTVIPSPRPTTVAVRAISEARIAMLLGARCSFK